MKAIAESSSSSDGISAATILDGIPKLVDPEMPAGLVTSESDDEEEIVRKHAIAFENSGDDVDGYDDIGPFVDERMTAR